MYFPYLRGKQFELLALRELASLPLSSSKVLPIIEPLKIDIRPITTMIRSMPRDLLIHLIVNPEYGEIKNQNRIISNLIATLHAASYLNVIPTFIISTNKDLTLLKTFLTHYHFDESGYSLVHLNQIAGSSDLNSIIRDTNCKFNIITVGGHTMALRRSFPKPSLVYLTDPFNLQEKNANYENNTDENFSDDHLYYREEGYVGFGDYLTIGSTFKDGGRLPWAVVIHLTYLDSDSRTIRIRHFVSDSNQDDSDTAGKFDEALNKLIPFINENRIHSIASEVFRDLHIRGAYPGLGTIKKLSIMHHIELIQSLL